MTDRDTAAPAPEPPLYRISKDGDGIKVTTTSTAAPAPSVPNGLQHIMSLARDYAKTGKHTEYNILRAAVEQIALQTKQADERGDEAMRLYHEAMDRAERAEREAAELQGALTEAICKWREAERERDALALQVKMQPAPMADCPVYCKTAVDLKERAERAERERDDNATECEIHAACTRAQKERAERAEREAAELRKLIMWALGEGDEFPDRPANWDRLTMKPWYWWRTELRARLAAIDAAREQK